MENVLKDVEEACRIIDGKDRNLNYGRIYYQSNESLNDLFSHFSVEGKDVLTVLGSGDQPFYAYYYGAKSVDTFDINLLTKHYYYLRKWGIEYLNTFYPPRDLFYQNHEWISKLLDIVRVDSSDPLECSAYLFWSHFIRNAFPFDNPNLYYFNSRGPKNIVEDLSSLKRRLEGQRLFFHHQNLFQDVDQSKKYDIIITSNILEHASDTLQVIRCRDNLNSLLKEDGKVICSLVMDHSHSLYRVMERDAFSRYFDYQEFPEYIREDLFSHSFPLGYVYTKRSVNKK